MALPDQLFSYALTGALVIVTGMVLDNIAQYFQLPISEMSNTFTFLNAGILAAVFLNAADGYCATQAPVDLWLCADDPRRGRADDQP